MRAVAASDLFAVSEYRTANGESRFPDGLSIIDFRTGKDFVMPTPNTSTPLGQLPAQAVHQRFATRPALYSVVFNALRSRLLERYPSLELDLLAVKLASPTPSGAYTYRPLMEVAIAQVLDPQLLDWRSKRELPYYLTQRPPAILKPAALPLIDMQVVAGIVDQVRASLYLHFQHDLADYWSAIDSHGRSRWQWLSEFLNGQMTAAAAGQSSLGKNQQDMLTAVATWPVRVERLPHSSPTTYVYFIESTLSKGAEETRLLTPDLLLVRDQTVLLYSVDGVIEAFASIEDFSKAWGARMQRQFQFDHLTWRRNEPDGNVFEQQAGLILNQQLEDLAALTFQGQDEKTLEQRLNTFTDPAVFFTQVKTPAAPSLQKIVDQLPEWLTQASADDRFAYHRHQQDMASVLRQNQGRSFDEGIENIHSFSRAALRKQMQIDHGDFDPDEVVLDFSVAAGYPGGAGIIDHVHMSLTQLALKNLAGKPKGTLKLSTRGAQALPTWLDENYLLGSTGLIQRVDIGSTYPQKIKDLLLSDSADARRRETLFTRELKVKLPRQALEYKIRQQHGITVTGYRYMKALMGEMPSDRLVDGHEIVLRPLALCRKPGAQPDEVNNAFIIEPKDASAGPHLLYQPLYTDCLHEYPTRQALLDALAEPGELQDSVLTWLTDKARPIYDHNGIKEPHLIRFLPGDEFSPPRQPVSASLAIDEGAGEWLQSQVNGQLLNHLYGSTARALVDLADRESVSNSESRWAIVMEGAWLLFNTLLLPLVQGPAMLVGWFMVLVASLEQDLAGLDSDDPTTRELALIDLLLNTAMVLLHAATPSGRPSQPLPERAAVDRGLHLAAWRRPVGLPYSPGTTAVRHGAVSLPGEPPASGHTALDFSRSLASPQASAKLFKALSDVHVPWPDALPIAQASGPLQGLYLINGTWHASVGGLLFQVSVVPGFGEVYVVHPQHPQHPGFKLVSDGQGHWRLDRGARLEGGMPRERLSKRDHDRNERLKVLNGELKQLNTQVVQSMGPSIRRKAAMDDARKNLIKQREGLRKDWLLLATHITVPGLREKIVERHEQRRLATAIARARWNAALDIYLEDAQASMVTMQKIAAKAEALMEADRSEPAYERRRNIAVKSMYDASGAHYEILLQKLLDTLETERGESASELAERSNSQLAQNIADAYQEILAIRKEQIALLKQMLEPAGKMETLLEQASPVLRQFLLHERPADQYISTITIKQHRLIFLIDLVLDLSHPSRSLTEFPFVRDLNDPQTAVSVLAHTEMRTTSGYSRAEQIDVLKNVLERYERLENAVKSLGEQGSNFVREDYRDEFLEGLAAARSSLDTQLANLILVDEGFAPAGLLDKPIRHKSANRRVIKTLDSKSVVGELRQGRADTPGNVVDVTDPLTGETVASYHEHADSGFWQVIKPASAARVPAPAPVRRSLKTIKAQALTIRSERVGIERSIEYQQKKLSQGLRAESINPREWEVMLTQHAEKFDALAEELKRDRPEEAAAKALRDEYLEEARTVNRLAHKLCSQGYKLQRPNASNIAYLWKHGFVDINLRRERFQLLAGDYLTEYAIRDTDKIRAAMPLEDADLWYAHFHYPAIDTSPLEPTFGHLKTKAERRFTRRELIEQARADNRAVVNLDKAEIKAPLDRELFLGLEVLA